MPCIGTIVCKSVKQVALEQKAQQPPPHQEAQTLFHHAPDTAASWWYTQKVVCLATAVLRNTVGEQEQYMHCICVQKQQGSWPPGFTQVTRLLEGKT